MAPRPFLGGHLLMQPGAYLYRLLSGSMGAHGAGEAALRVDPTVRNALSEFSCQAFVLDPSAPQGVAMSAAMDVRLL